MPDQPKKVQFNYVISDGYEPDFANGAYGSATPKGEIIIHFYHERPPLPTTDSHAVLPSGQLNTVPERAPVDVVTVERHVVNGVVVTGDTAQALYVWLGQKLAELRVQQEMQKAKQPGPPH